MDMHTPKDELHRDTLRRLLKSESCLTGDTFNLSQDEWRDIHCAMDGPDLKILGLIRIRVIGTELRYEYEYRDSGAKISGNINPDQLSSWGVARILNALIRFAVSSG